MSDYRCVCGGDLRRQGWQEMYRQRSGQPSAAEAAAQILRETGNQAIGWGDAWLLHEVARRIGVVSEGPKPEKAILDRIERTYKGALLKRYATYPSRGLSRVRQYALPGGEQHSPLAHSQIPA